MTDLPAVGAIPQSSALSEASPDSLTELLSRDPEGYSRQDLDRIIALMREQRSRWEAAAAAAPKGRARVAPGRSTLGTTVAASLDDLGL